MGARVEEVWGSLSGTIGKASHSLISHTKAGCKKHKRSGRPAEISFTSANTYVASPHNR